jgi:hypothetical protein
VWSLWCVATARASGPTCFHVVVGMHPCCLSRSHVIGMLARNHAIGTHPCYWHAPRCWGLQGCESLTCKTSGAPLYTAWVSPACVMALVCVFTPCVLSAHCPRVSRSAGCSPAARVVEGPQEEGGMGSAAGAEARPGPGGQTGFGGRQGVCWCACAYAGLHATQSLAGPLAGHLFLQSW